MQVQLLVWIFVMRIMMVVSSGISYFINEAIAKARYSAMPKFNYEAPLTFLVWLTSIVSIVATYIVSYFVIPDLGGDTTLWWKLSSVITCGTLAGALIPELVKIFTSTRNPPTCGKLLLHRAEGGASLNILSGLVAGNFSAFWLGFTPMLLLMGAAYGLSTLGLAGLMVAPAVFAFGLVAFGFLGMGPVTIAVDSYGPVTDNAQSVYELSLIENVPNIKQELKSKWNIDVNFERAKGKSGRERWRGQYVQSDGETGFDRHRGGGRHDHDFLDYRAAHQWADDQSRKSCRFCIRHIFWGCWPAARSFTGSPALPCRL